MLNFNFENKFSNADYLGHTETEREWNLRLFLEKAKLPKSQTFSANTNMPKESADCLLNCCSVKNVDKFE